MKADTFGGMIASLRKANGMTQLELAEKMSVTDKAVSKWERDLSFPDVNSLPKLAEIFGVTVDELMQAKTQTAKKVPVGKVSGMVALAMEAVAAAMGVAVSVLSVMNRLETESAVRMLGIGLACLAIVQLSKRKE